jgi:hypothetical protein
LHQQFVQCFADTAEFGTCNYPTFDCIDPLIAWAFDCEGWQPGNVLCDQMGPGGDCWCYFEVFEPSFYFFEQYCYNTGGGQIVCDCVRNGEYTGTCIGEDPFAACDPIGGCCMAMNVIDLP